MSKKVLNGNEEFKVKVRIFDLESEYENLKNKLQIANLYYTVKKQDGGLVYTIEVNIKTVIIVYRIFKDYLVIK